MGSDRERSRSPHRSDSEGGEQWKCGNCNTENTTTRGSCTKCKLPKGKDKKDIFTEDWECPKCRSNNFSRRIDCFKCHSRKPPADPKHPYDWECNRCKGNNFSRRVDCFKCGEPKPLFISSGQPAGEQEPLRPGSWYCECSAVNYSRRTDCYKCHAPKPRSYSYNARNGAGNTTYNVVGLGGGAGGMSRIRSPTPERGYRQRSPIRSFQGGAPERAPDVDPLTGEAEWLCPVCGVSNFYKRFDCYRCFEKKPLDSLIGRAGGRSFSEPRDTTAYTEPSHTTYSAYHAPPSSVPPSGPLSIPKKRFPQDWICPDCHGLNYSKRTDCFKCHLAKPEQDYDGTGTPNKNLAAVQNKGDWLCTSCGGNNFSRRTDCYRCSVAKPAAGEDAETTDISAAATPRQRAW